MPPGVCFAGRPAPLRRKRRLPQLARGDDTSAVDPPAPADGTLSTLQQDVLLKILEGLKVRKLVRTKMFSPP
jgi:hypothetical protein